MAATKGLDAVEIVRELSADEELARQFEEAKRGGRYIEIMDDAPDSHVHDLLLRRGVQPKHRSLERRKVLGLNRATLYREVY